MADRKILSEYIDKQLRMHRPDRYDPKDITWLENVAESIPDEMLPVDEIRKLYKMNLIKQREGNATRSANRILRNFNANGQLELHWWQEANEPIAIEWVEFDDEGREVKRLERVALRAASPIDLRAWAENEEARAQQDFEARMETVDGARQIAEQIESGGFVNFQAWADATVEPCAKAG